jgi:hypothetical protein
LSYGSHRSAAACHPDGTHGQRSGQYRAHQRTEHRAAVGPVSHGLHASRLGVLDLVGRARIAPITNLYFVNAAGNAAWIFAWHYRLVALSVAIMLLILATLIAIFIRLRRLGSPSAAEFLCVDGVFAIYFGWITTATLVNFATLFFDLGWYPFGLSMDQWALATVCAAGAIYVWMGAVTRNAAYCAVFVWAAVGVYLGGAQVTGPVRIAALTGAVTVLACLVWALFMPRQRALFRGP